MKGFKATAFAAASIATAVALAACGSSSDSSDSSSSDGGDSGSAPAELKIAYQGPLSGDNAAYGTYAKAGIEIAIADYTAAHPDAPKVTAFYGDSQGDPAQAPAVATQIINDDSIVGVTGPAFSGETNATGPAYAEAGLVTVSMSATNPALTTNGWNTFFRVVANDNAQGPAAAKMLQDNGFTKIFVVDDTSDYGKGLGDIIRETLGDHAGDDSPAADTKDYSATVTKVKDAEADAVYYAGYAAGAATFLKALRDAGWEGTFASGDGTVDAAFFTAGDFVEGTLLTFPGVLDEEGSGSDLATKYDALTVSDKGTIGAYTAEAYDAATTILNCIADGDYDRASIRDCVAASDYDGITKHIKFDETGEITGASGVYYYKVVGGKATEGTEIK